MDEILEALWRPIRWILRFTFEFIFDWCFEHLGCLVLRYVLRIKNPSSGASAATGCVIWICVAIAIFLLTVRS